MGEWQEQGSITGVGQGPAGGMDELGEDGAGSSYMQHGSKTLLAGK